MTAEQYQLFGPLRDEEYQALKADIAKRGVMVPVEVDEHGNLLDGHHRARACRELGLPAPPSITRIGLDESAKVEHVLKLNLLRRHLGPISWADGFRRLANLRGVELGAKHNRHTPRADTVTALAEEVGAEPRTARRRLQIAEELASHPDLAEKVDAGQMEVKRAQRVIRERAAEERRHQPVDPVTQHGLVEIRHGDAFDTATLADLGRGTVDAIITDPPYDREFWPRYEGLGRLARHFLKVDGVLAIMIGTRLEMLDSVDELIGRSMRRRHRAIYLTPGPRWRDHLERVATGYKPILIYAHPAASDLAWINDDIFGSKADDKRFHHWGQSESGMASLVERLTEPGHLVVDPFLGGGTTAVVCRDLGRRFIGCDVDPAAVAIARERVA